MTAGWQPVQNLDEAAAVTNLLLPVAQADASTPPTPKIELDSGACRLSEGSYGQIGVRWQPLSERLQCLHEIAWAMTEGALMFFIQRRQLRQAPCTGAWSRHSRRCCCAWAEGAAQNRTSPPSNPFGCFRHEPDYGLRKLDIQHPRIQR
jgi:hypothetical protein